MTPDDKKKLENQFQDFVKKIEKRGFRWFLFDLGDLPAVIVIDDRAAERIAITAHIPYMKEAEIGHVFATGIEGEFAIKDIFVEPECREHEIGSNLVKGTISAIEKFNPALIDGNFEFLIETFPYFKRLFKKYEFAVAVDSGRVTIFKEYTGNLREKKKNQ